MKGWMSYLDYLDGMSDKLLKQLEEEKTDTIEELLALDGKDRAIPYIGKYSIPRIQKLITMTGVDYVKLRISKKAGKDIKYLDYSALLGERERAYLHDISVCDIGLTNREQHALINNSCPTLDDLCLMPAAKIFRFRGLGTQSVENILDVRHKWYLKVKKSGIPEELAERYTDSGRLYSSIARQFRPFADIRHEEVRDALQASDREGENTRIMSGEDLTGDDYLYIMTHAKTISDKLLKALDTRTVPPNRGFTMAQVRKIIRENIENEVLGETLESFSKKI